MACWLGVSLIPTILALSVISLFGLGILLFHYFHKVSAYAFIEPVGVLLQFFRPLPSVLFETLLRTQ
jgi:hypothetical protein